LSVGSVLGFDGRALSVDGFGVGSDGSVGSGLESLDLLLDGRRVLDDVGGELVAKVDGRSSSTGFAVSEDVVGLGDVVDSFGVLASSAEDELRMEWKGDGWWKRRDARRKDEEATEEEEKGTKERRVRSTARRTKTRVMQR